jgi:hypothetical protein
MARKHISMILSKNIRHGRAYIDLDAPLPPLVHKKKIFKETSDDFQDYDRIKFMILGFVFGTVIVVSFIYMITRNHYSMLKMIKPNY